MNKKKQVTVYTDGACSGNPGPGGWGCVLIFGPHRKELAGAERESTNQRMELMAALRALEQLREPCHVLLHSDSAYLINGFIKGWLDKWEKNGWINSKRQPVENQDIWRPLREIARGHEIEWIKVKGHAGNIENERCDQLAKEALLRYN